MTLGELIARLEQESPAKIVPNGFYSPHSYRGDYYELAFEPAKNTTVQAMLDAAKGALGFTFGGYKGGEFTMGLYSGVYLANAGETGEELGKRLLEYMLAEKP